MKANELMIGDWVQLPTFSRPSRVTAIQDNEVIFTDAEPGIGGSADIEKVGPVLLTAGILKDNGFFCDDQIINGGRKTTCIFDNIGKIPLLGCDVKIGWKMEWRGQDFDAHIYNTGGGEYIGHIVYVHHLQHALRSCGIEKDIEL
jgi:hypothetical protein